MVSGDTAVDNWPIDGAAGCADAVPWEQPAAAAQQQPPSVAQQLLAAVECDLAVGDGAIVQGQPTATAGREASSVDTAVSQTSTK